MSPLVRAVLVAPLLISGEYAASAQAADIVTQTVQPSKTGSGISSETVATNYHYIAQPRAAAERKDVLVVFLGGSGTSPNAYTAISDEAAKQGFGTIGLRYPNALMVGTACATSDACFSSLRGETIFGQDVAYPGIPARYDSLLTAVSRQNSIVNRLVSLLHFLRTQPPDALRNPTPAYWSQFLVAAPGSPYEAGGVALLPDWSRIVVAGHSQGAGHAAVLGATLPTALRRVVMFSAPNDHIRGNSASWIFGRAATPGARFWGMRSAQEGTYGDFVALNWQNMEVGGTAPATVERDVNTGLGATSGSQRLVLSPASTDSLTNHNSTAANGRYDAIYPTLAEDRKVAWRYLLTGGFAD